METYYLVDFENVNNEGIENIENMAKSDHVHVFSTPNAINIRQDIFWLKGDIQSHLVSAGKQSLDKHLVSYLGYILGIHGKDCAYVIVSKDNGYDNIVKFWKSEGYPHISRKERLFNKASAPKKKTQTQSNTQSVNNSGIVHKYTGKERVKLNGFVQRELVGKGYKGDDVGKICKIVITHCNDEEKLNSIHDALEEKYSNYATVYEDVRDILKNFEEPQNKSSKSIDKTREMQVRSFFGQHFKKKIYVEQKEKIIQTIINADTKQQVNNGLLKIYSDGQVVSHIHKTIQPLIKDLPGS